MQQLLAIALGGAAGSLARYAISLWARSALGADFPYGTMTANVLGSFAMGVFAYLGRTTTLLPPTLALGLTTGVLGGFTTYSTFNDDTLRFLTAGAFAKAGANVALTLLLCLIAGFLGMLLARSIAATAHSQG